MKYYPLRPIQRWLIDTHFNKAKSTMMNIGGLFKLAAAIDMQHLAESINLVIKQHDIFRCRLVFDPQTSDMCQTFDDENIPVKVEYLSDDEFEARMKKLREPYQLIAKPLWRIYVIETPAKKYLYVDFYHAIMDGVSTSYLFLREIDAAYRGRTAKPALSYAAYVEEESKISPEELAAGHDYWRKMLSHFDKQKHLPPTTINSDAAWTKGTFEYKFKGLTEEFFRGSRISENNFFLGACMIALAKITGSKESVMSWTHNGRNTMSERRLMGLMLEQYPCTWDFREDISVEEFVDRLHGQMRIAMKYRKSLDIVYNERLEDDCVSFIFQKMTYGNLILADTSLEPIYLPPNEISAVENALKIAINSGETGIYDLILTYDSSRYSEKDMSNFAETLNKILVFMRDTKKKTSEI